MEAARWISVGWCCFAAFWYTVGVGATKNVAGEPRWTCWVHESLMFISVFLVTGIGVDGFLNGVTPMTQLDINGVALFIPGMALAIWARWHLATNWSTAISLKADHKLVITGPYAAMKHPIYVGLALMYLGSWMTIGNYRGLIGVLLAWSTMAVRAHYEDRLLSKHFGR